MKRIYLLVSLLTSLMLLVACGGGGGSDEEEVETLTYTGAKTAAVINTENADDVAQIIFGPETTPVSGIAGVVIEDGDTKTLLFGNHLTPQVVTDIQLEISQMDTFVLPGAVYEYEETYSCQDGGTVTEYFKLDNITWKFWLNFHFHNCVTDDLYQDGKIEIVGAFYPDTTESLTETWTFVYYTESIAGESFTYQGQLYFPDLTSSTIKRIYNYLVRDDSSLKVFKYSDYQFVSTVAYDLATFTVDGRLYHPNYGYVDVITQVPFTLMYDQSRFSSGSVIAIGDSSSLKLICEDTQTYTLAVDTNGDGLYEIATTENW